MFRSPAPEPTRDDEGTLVSIQTDLIPLRVLELELGALPDWASFLAARGISIKVDDIGMLSVSRADAKALVSERRQAEARAREVAAQQEAAFVETDREFQASVYRGIPWYEVPPDVNPASAMLAASKPRRTSLQEALDHPGQMLHDSTKDE